VGSSPTSTILKTKRKSSKMTEKCVEMAEKLKDVIMNDEFEKLSTEAFIVAWGEINGVDDLYSVLVSMVEKPSELCSDKIQDDIETIKTFKSWKGSDRDSDKAIAGPERVETGLTLQMPKDAYIEHGDIKITFSQSAQYSAILNVDDGVGNVDHFFTPDSYDGNCILVAVTGPSKTDESSAVKEELLVALEGARNFLMGVQLDPLVPQSVKESLVEKSIEVDEVIQRHID
jgi:hypothetical protein